MNWLEEYKQNYQKFIDGKICYQEWSEFCFNYLMDLLSEPEILKVLEKLKDR